MHRMILMTTLLVLFTWTTVESQTKTKDASKTKSKSAAKSKSASNPPSPVGRPVQDKVKVRTKRYFVWYDSTGWHLRTASKLMRKFRGTITLTEGTFGKLRPIGLESKGKYRDRWVVNKERNEIKFEIYTGGSFDGFDFSAKSPDSAKVAYDLKFNEKSDPKKIFIGRAEKHPKTGKFSFAVKP